MKVSSELHYITGDIQHITTAFVIGVETQMRQAARAFLSAALARVPVRTGFAVAPFRNIAEASNIAGYASQLTRRKDFKANFRKERKLKNFKKQVEQRRNFYATFLQQERQNALLDQQIDRDYERDLQSLVDKLESILERVRQKRLELARLRGTVIETLKANRASRLKTLKVRRKGSYKKSRLQNTFEALRAKMQLEGQFIGNRLDPLRQRDAELSGVEYYRDGKSLVPKNPTTGRKYGTPPDKIFGRERQFLFTFNFENTIKYFRIEDEYGKNSPTAPWKAMLAGSEAFINYWRRYGFKRLPRFIFLPRRFGSEQNPGRDQVVNLADLLVVSKYTVDGKLIKTETIKPANRVNTQQQKATGDTRPLTQGFRSTNAAGQATENPEAEKSFKTASRENRSTSNREKNLRNLKLRAAERRLKKNLKKAEAKAKFQEIITKKVNKQQEIFQKLVESIANLQERRKKYKVTKLLLEDDPDKEFRFKKKKKKKKRRPEGY